MRFLAGLLLLVALAAASPDETAYVVYGAHGPVLTLVPMRGRMPQAEIEMVSVAWSAVDCNRPPVLMALPDGTTLLVWRGSYGRSSCARLYFDEGGVREQLLGDWSDGWLPHASADLNGDGLLDLLIARAHGAGDSAAWIYKIVPGTSGGGFALAAQMRGGEVMAHGRRVFFALGDVSGDDKADLVFFSVPNGGFFQTQLLVRRGNGKGGFPGRTYPVGRSPEPATAPVLCDIDKDGDLDIVLGADDDGADKGQTFVALNDGRGGFRDIQPLRDFRPEEERRSADSFSAYASAVDLDTDGHTDLFWRLYDHTRRQHVYTMVWGAPGGGLEEHDTPIVTGSWSNAPAPGVGWLTRVKSPAPPPVAPLDEHEVERLWEDMTHPLVSRGSRAMSRLIELGDAGVDLLRARYGAEPDMVAHVRDLVLALDDPEPDARAWANRKLERLGAAAESILQQSLRNAQSPESRRRLVGLLDKLERTPRRALTADARRALRAVAVLERVGGCDAEQVLRKIMLIAPDGYVQRQAGQALVRLNPKAR